MAWYLWVKDEPAGMEHAELDIDNGGLVVTSVAFGTVPVPYRLDFDLTVGADWITRRLALRASGDGWTRSLVLACESAGTGPAPGPPTAPCLQRSRSRR